MDEEVNLAHAQVVRLQPGDVVVLRAPMVLTQTQRANLAHMLRSRFPDNQVIVMDAAVDLCIVRPE